MGYRAEDAAVVTRNVFGVRLCSPLGSPSPQPLLQRDPQIPASHSVRGWNLRFSQWEIWGSGLRAPAPIGIRYYRYGYEVGDQAYK